MALRATRRDELEGKTALDVRGLSSRPKFHKQYRRNGIPTARIRASKYAVMDQSFLEAFTFDHDRKDLKKYWRKHEDSIKTRRFL
jgi:hypothetical protein